MIDDIIFKIPLESSGPKSRFSTYVKLIKILEIWMIGILSTGNLNISLISVSKINDERFSFSKNSDKNFVAKV